MSRQDANAAFALSSFLYGSNAPYIEEMYARFEENPGSVDSEWQEFFKSLKDQPADVKRGAEGPSWEQPNWPVVARDDLVPLEVAVFVARDAPVEQIDVEPSGRERFDHAHARAQIEHVPTVDERRHEQDRCATCAHRSAKAQQARGAVAQDDIARRGSDHVRLR